jgi:hypothetical protein
MLSRLFAALALVTCSGCSYERFIRFPLSDDQLEAAAPAAARDMECAESEVQSRYRTLLTRTVQGCGREVVYSYDWMLDRWWGDFDAAP